MKKDFFFYDVVLLHSYTLLCAFSMLRPNPWVLAHCGTHRLYLYLVMSVVNCRLLILNVPEGITVCATMCPLQTSLCQCPPFACGTSHYSYAFLQHILGPSVWNCPVRFWLYT
jgi:hypothetical protein